MKYVVRFNTTGYKSVRRKDWHLQLYNDFVVAVNGWEYQCATEEETFEKLRQIQGQNVNTSLDNCIFLESEKYGKQVMEVKVPGLAMGYVDFDEVMKQANEKGMASISFADFYDLRQGCPFKNCYVEIWRR